MQKKAISVTPSGKVFLTLPGKSYKSRRHIGDIIGDTLHVHRDPSKHFFYQFNGYGFSYELIRDGNFNQVVVHLGFGQEHVTTRRHILSKGKFLNFKRNQLEKQIFLSVDEFGLDKAEKSEQQMIKPKTAPFQLSMFGGIQ